MEVKITVDSPLWFDFKRWRVQEASPDSYVNVMFIREGADEPSLELTIKVPGHFYCSGAYNFETERASVAEFNVNEDVKEENIQEMVNLVTVQALRRVLEGTLLKNEEEWIKSVIEEAMFDHPF